MATWPRWKIYWSGSKEIAINSVNSALSESDLATLADEVAELKNELLDTANAVVDGKYIFAGYQEDTEPFTENRRLRSCPL